MGFGILSKAEMTLNMAKHGLPNEREPGSQYCGSPTFVILSFSPILHMNTNHVYIDAHIGVLIHYIHGHLM